MHKLTKKAEVLITAGSITSLVMFLSLLLSVYVVKSSKSPENVLYPLSYSSVEAYKQSFEKTAESYPQNSVFVCNNIFCINTNKSTYLYLIGRRLGDASVDEQPVSENDAATEENESVAGEDDIDLLLNNIASFNGGASAQQLSKLIKDNCTPITNVDFADLFRKHTLFVNFNKKVSSMMPLLLSTLKKRQALLVNEVNDNLNIEMKLISICNYIFKLIGLMTPIFPMLNADNDFYEKITESFSTLNLTIVKRDGTVEKKVDDIEYLASQSLPTIFYTAATNVLSADNVFGSGKAVFNFFNELNKTERDPNTSVDLTNRENFQIMWYFLPENVFLGEVIGNYLNYLNASMPLTTSRSHIEGIREEPFIQRLTRYFNNYR